jgi:protein tyrosine phosphatase (PTP) superfamily phosphohydrolase (DUF442 family)
MSESVADIFNFRPVAAGLATSGQPSEQQLALIAAAGFDVVINLALHDDPRYSLHDEAGNVRDLGMQYVHIPVQFDAPEKSDLLAFFDAMERHRGHRIWVHCAANMRVTAFLGLYRVLRERRSRTQAFQLMDSVWKPNAVWTAFIAAILGDNPDG